MSVLVYEPPARTTLDDLEVELSRAFVVLRDALERGDAVVVSLEERHVQGVDETADAALAHGLLGLARALAVEGQKPGWRVAVLSSPSDTDPAERQRWIEHLAESESSRGSLVRLGGEHLGRVVV